MARRRGEDKLFKREKEKRDFARKKANKELVKSIIIACEDSVSSPTYFKMIIDTLKQKKKITPHSIIVPHDGHTEPTGVLNNLKKYNKNGFTYKDYEHKWIVIDRDSECRGGGHTKENFKEALKNAKSERKDLHIDVAYSNDSFELWYLLHFDYRDTAIMRDEIIEKVIIKLKEVGPHIFSKLTKYNIKEERYTKHIFKTLLSSQEDAIQNAKKLLKFHGNHHKPEDDNPSTTVYKLVILLNNLQNSMV